MELIKDQVKSIGSVNLGEILGERQLYHSSAFKRLEIQSPKSVKLLNQKELFTIAKGGKQIASKYVPPEEKAEYGEILIAGVGTKGETELFCRAEFVGKELEGECVASEFIRFKTKREWHPGYVYAWLSSNHGFRMIRGTESGTKLCRPIKRLLMEIPIPQLTKTLRDEIGEQVEAAYKMRFQAMKKEREAISLIEQELS